MDRGLYDREKAAEFLSVSERTFDRLVAAGKIKKRRIGVLVRYAHADLMEFIEDLPTKASNNREPRKVS
jgi:excisionase family DNA binding protein